VEKGLGRGQYQNRFTIPLDQPGRLNGTNFCSSLTSKKPLEWRGAAMADERRDQISIAYRGFRAAASGPLAIAALILLAAEGGFFLGHWWGMW
jgi:hypothetical protein